jgi:hypothetical protein
MPFGRGLGAKLAYLRHQGFEYVLVQAEPKGGLYTRAPWEHNLKPGTALVYRRWTPYVLEWLDDAAALAARPTALHFGALALVKI